MDTTEFKSRQIEQSPQSIDAMLKYLKVSSLEELVRAAIPHEVAADINKEMNLPQALSEEKALELIQIIAQKNRKTKSFIGQGYTNAIMPSVIKRNILENPGWYTSYTAYQSEISQGRLEALFNFQTLTSELTGLPISNASLLDEGTAVAEAVQLAHRYHKGKRNEVMVIEGLYTQSVEVLSTRARALDIKVKYCTKKSLSDMQDCCAVVVQLPSRQGNVFDIDAIVRQAHEQGVLVVAAVDPMFMVLAESPGKWGVDIAVGSFQRFGLPLGYGGPHAAFFSTQEFLKRLIPGRIVGQTKDSKGRIAYRFALQTREQHIRREKATSNICTSQVLLAILSSMYGVYHGPHGLSDIANRIHSFAQLFYRQLKNAHISVYNEGFFDAITWHAGSRASMIHTELLEAGYNIFRIGQEILSICFDESTTQKDFDIISNSVDLSAIIDESHIQKPQDGIPQSMLRSAPFLTQKVFHRYHTETEMMRYIRNLSDKDLALDRTMIPLGSCTMKLNAVSELIPISWSAFADIHPFVPIDQAFGYHTIILQLKKYLCEITGFDEMSLQPNAGSQGEYAGLLAIKAYHESLGEAHRNICLIPSSAHGTNPASAHMANMKVVIVQCDKQGNIDMNDLLEKAEAHAETLSAIMITYPSTHGVYETKIKEITQIIHEYGGQVYIDGANLNALVGHVTLTELGADLAHLNLHKTFAIPHGGGGPGAGPIGVKSHLFPFLPYNMLESLPPNPHPHSYIKTNKADVPLVGAVSAAPWGSPLIFVISWMYIRMMGAQGLREATARAVVNANYIASRLKDHYSILYTGDKGLVAHECIVDVREFKLLGIEVEDIAKRLIDYGYHAPTMSWPVSGTLMIEPTESESKYELDRFCDAMISIREEINKIAKGVWSKEDNPLVHAPHCAQDICEDDWDHAYSRKVAAYPYLTEGSYAEDSDQTLPVREKYWAPVSRVDNAYGDKNLVCTRPAISSEPTISDD